ncbi:helix-turn-helix domain-containing protein [Rhizobium sp. GN54]|uniref:helix-turn-helix domain-containing protein n=1 Tax=Rhizobium sp. GN54 TaxID=2898150 RepID=UPI001E2E4A9A|nr:helix-turn-helix transcriptional regulator [Rhizobium sp. GN54]MCD2184204.1 helix-turn-helix domain-containing protein [Rhizobium sp. GN54]
MNDENRANQIDVAVGANLRRIRSLRQMSQEALAAQLGITFQQIQKYEKGFNRISASKLVLTAEALECDLSSLFAGVADERHYDPIPLLSMRAVKLAALYDRLSDEPVRDALFKLALTLAGDGETESDSTSSPFT